VVGAYGGVGLALAKTLMSLNSTARTTAVNIGSPGYREQEAPRALRDGDRNYPCGYRERTRKRLRACPTTVPRFQRDRAENDVAHQAKKFGE
jgi:hypothetical protein